MERKAWGKSAAKAPTEPVNKTTLVFFSSKKHVKVDQGLDLLILDQGTKEKQKKHQGTKRNNHIPLGVCLFLFGFRCFS